ncbi:MAG: hypothetical protein M2R45_02058 [Verrucomicrobia subdivision 3 bacterium]|nr:hypothetical protein [Limisphaerales bacterium]MCS1414877.1 hypothetical protein [Limisphaerales bacterium]
MVVDQYPDSAPDRQAGHYIFSITKSVLSAVVNVAVDRGHIQSDEQPVADFSERSVNRSGSGKEESACQTPITMTTGLGTSLCYT